MSSVDDSFNVHGVMYKIYTLYCLYFRMRSFTFVSTQSVMEIQSCFTTKVELTLETWMLRWDMMETGKGLCGV